MDKKDILLKRALRKVEDLFSSSKKILLIEPIKLFEQSPKIKETKLKLDAVGHKTNQLLENIKRSIKSFSNVLKNLKNKQHQAPKTSTSKQKYKNNLYHTQHFQTDKTDQKAHHTEMNRVAILINYLNKTQEKLSEIYQNHEQHHYQQKDQFTHILFINENANHAHDEHKIKDIIKRIYTVLSEQRFYHNATLKKRSAINQIIEYLVKNKYSSSGGKKITNKIDNQLKWLDVSISKKKYLQHK